MRVGILGTGFGTYHAQLYKKMSKVSVVKVFGRQQEKLKTLEAMGCDVTDTLSEVIDATDLDLVDICLPSDLHETYGVEVLKQGKALLLETPAVLRPSDAETLLSVSRQSGKPIFVNLFIRFEPAYVQLKKWVESGEFGKLRGLNIRRDTPPFWGDLGRHKIVPSLMIHEFDFITWLLGKPLKVKASLSERDATSAQVNVLLDYSDTTVAVQASSMLPVTHAFSVGFQAIFDDATVTFYEDGYEDHIEKEMKCFTKEGVVKVPLSDDNCYEKSLEHVLACCEKGIESTIVSLSEAIKSLEVVFEVERLIRKS